MNDPEMKGSSELVLRANQILDEVGIMQNRYFARLVSGQMSQAEFSRSQRQFYFAVDFFSRPMSALLMRMKCPKSRLAILANVVEEHGNFQPAAFHEATFRQFLEALGDDSADGASEMGAPVHAFNSTIMSACTSDELQIGIACLGIIEYAFADISALIGNAVVERNWVSKEDLVHYSIHAAIDKQHAADFFELVQRDWGDPHGKGLVEQGLRLGAYAFDRLYCDLAP
jgi:pyrroloquinoline-quinone synthase